VHHGGEVLYPDGRQSSPDVVLNSLDVVDGDGFYFREFIDGCSIEFGNDGTQPGHLIIGQRTRARQNGLAGQVDEPLNFNVNAIAVQCGLGQVVHEGRDGGAVAAVKGAESEGFGSEGHAVGFSHEVYSFMFRAGPWSR
jgi:hypothetical protein